MEMYIRRSEREIGGVAFEKGKGTKGGGGVEFEVLLKVHHCILVSFSLSLSLCLSQYSSFSFALTALICIRAYHSSIFIWELWQWHPAPPLPILLSSQLLTSHHKHRRMKRREGCVAYKIIPILLLSLTLSTAPCPREVSL